MQIGIRTSFPINDLQQGRKNLMEKAEQIINIQPLVSTIIPTYNRPELLKRSVRSAQRQTYKKLEIIIVDDASSDSTKATVQSFNDPRIKYVRHNINKGGSASRNTGIELSQGDYIAFLDDDDEWVDKKIEQQLSHINGYDAILCSTTIVGKRARIRHYRKPIVDVNDLKKGFIFSGGTNILLARSEVLRQLKFDEKLKNGQDFDLLIRLAKNFTVRYVNDPLVIYHDEEHERITNKILIMPIKEIDNYLGVIDKHKHFFGSYWYNYHVARRILAYFGRREKKRDYLVYAIKRCGVFPVFRVFLDRIFARLKSYTNNQKNHQ